MDKIVRPGRLAMLAVLIGVVVLIYGAAMYELQISDQETYTAVASGNYSTTTTVSAARGNLLDRNGTVLVSSRASYNIVLSRDEIVFSDDPNAVVTELIRMANDFGIDYTDTFPITSSAPYSWIADMTSTQRGRLEAYFEFFSSLHDSSGNPKEMTASDFIVWLKNHYGIDYTVPISEVRQIIGVRYELELRAISNISSYVFVEDVGTDFVAAVLERDLPGITITVTTTREYHTGNAAHILGYTGKMTADEYYDTYKAQNYPYDAVVGKSGVELAFEQYLHGTDGKVVTTYNPDGKIINQETLREASAGNNVLLSIDIGLQTETESALSNAISMLNARRTAGLTDAGEEPTKPEQVNKQLAEGGAVVVMDVKTSQVLAMASYPTYDPSTLFQNYSYLSNDALRPMFNRATQGTYNPGSTFKMVTSLAGLRHNTITLETQIYDESKFTKYPDYQPRCWIYPYSHGPLTVVGALENSCNYFFYKIADDMGIMAIAETATMFGLGSKTGIEIPEADGILPTPNYKENVLKEPWYAADNLLAAIGQGLNFYTPVQLANYCCTIAETGVHKRVTILNQVMSPDYTDIVYESRPEIINIISNNEGYITALQQGMIMVAARGTAKDMLSSYKPQVACKTGTTQAGGDVVNNGVFLCYAPCDAPEIAIAVVVEKGGSGAAIISVATDIMDYYFKGTTASTAMNAENAPMQ